MTKLIIFDMDGVIFEKTNFWFDLHEKYGTYRDGKELTDRYLKSNYQKLVDEVVGRLWKGKDANELYKLIANAKYIKGVKETFEELKERGYMIIIISSGEKLLAERAKKDLGIDFVYANQLIIKDDKLAGQFDWPVGDDKKDLILKLFCRMKKINLKDCTVVVQDENDRNLAKIVGNVIAFNPIDKEILRYTKQVVKKKDLRKILEFIE
ncbi:HAD family hydrolase [Nanoarchaeota archaeon]